MAVCRVDVCFMIATILICRLDVSTAAESVNIAVKATCTSSCQPLTKDCNSGEGALHQNGPWRYDGPPVGGWLKIVFDRTYILWSLRIQPYFWINLRYFKDIKLTFSDGSEQTVTMTNMNEGFVFETFPIYPPRLSSNMTLTVVSAYFNGDRVITHINVVEVYGTIPETMTTETTDATTAISAAKTAIPPETTLTSAATTVTLSATTGIPPEATTTPLSTTDTIQDKITVKASVVNITAKAKCSSSFDCQPTKKYCSSCYWAIDGDKSTSWHYRGAAVGEWLQIVFDRTYIVTLLHIVPSYWAAQRHFKQVKLTFSDGSEQTITLSNRNDGWVMETLMIDPRQLSSSINLSVVSAYDETDTVLNSINEVEVYGFIPATPATLSVTGTTTSSIGEPKAKPQQTKTQWKENILYITIGVLAVALLVTCTLLVFVFRRRMSRPPKEHELENIPTTEEHVYESTTGVEQRRNEGNEYDTIG